jgi:DnaJ-like protein
MKFDSPLFDRIRVKPSEDRRFQADAPTCDWQGCQNKATHRAPKGRLRENEYWRFCLDHVREYNHSYNYFAGMSQDAVSKYQKDAVTGHRPTWKMGTGNHPGPDIGPQGMRDPFNMFREFAGGAGWRPKAERVEPQRAVRNAERKALHELGLEVGADRVEIKARFKLLVKRHHPDANGGDRGSEDKLREIIQAYNYLKSTGAC